MKTIGTLIVIVALGAGGAYYYKLQASAPPAERFRTVPVQRGDLLSTISATGTIEPEEVVDVGAQVMGRIKDLGLDHEAENACDTQEPDAGKPKDQPRPSVANRPAAQGAGHTGAERTGPRRASADQGSQPAPDKRPRIDYGSIVHVGTELAFIDDTRYRAQVAQAEAALNRAMADLGQLQAKAVQAAAALRRAQELQAVEKNHHPLTDTPIVAISQSDYDLAVANDQVAKANLTVGKAVVEQNRASLDQAQTDLDYTVIKSPVEGVIIDRRVNIGQTVVAALNAPSLFLIAKDLSRLQVWASVNEADIGKIRKGMKVRFKVDAYPGETFEGQVKQIRLNAQMTSNVVLYTVVVETENPGGRLLPYLTANLEFEIEQLRDVLLVPNAALRWTPRQPAGGPAAGPPAPASDAAAKQNATEADEERGRIWVAEGGAARPIDVALGPSDGSVTVISGPDVHVGLAVIIGEEAAEQTAGEESTNPFGPPKFPRQKPARKP